MPSRARREGVEADERTVRCIVEWAVDGVGVGIRRGIGERVVRDCWSSAMRSSRRIWRRLYMGVGTLVAIGRLFT